MRPQQAVDRLGVCRVVPLAPDATVESAGIAGDGSTAPLPPSPPPASPSNIELNSQPRAGFWVRMGALTIDALIVAVVVNWLEPSGHLFLVALAGYGALMWKLKGTTIGGIVCNLRVVRTDGRDIEWETAIVRALSCFLSLIPAGLGLHLDAVRQQPPDLARQDRRHRGGASPEEHAAGLSIFAAGVAAAGAARVAGPSLLAC